MANYRVTNRGDFTIVTYRQKEALQVNQREMGLLDRNVVSGFMKPRWDTANEMSFLVPTAIPLKKYLTKDCTVEKVYNIFQRSIAAMKQVSANQMMMQNLLLDTKYVFVRSMSNEVYFIYEPYIKDASQVDVLSFYMSIISMAKIRDKGQQAQLEQFRQFVASHSRLEDIEAYIKQMLQRTSGVEMGTAFVNQPSGYMSGQLNSGVDMEDEGTTVLGYEDEGTTVLNAQADFEPETTVLRRDPILTLIRTKDGSTTQLTEIECTVGRAVDNFVSIRDNTDVSRYHAVITISNGAYFVTDRGSKNGTTLNGRDIVANVAEQIQNGDVLVFGGEEFTFRVEE